MNKSTAIQTARQVADHCLEVARTDPAKYCNIQYADRLLELMSFVSGLDNKPDAVKIEELLNRDFKSLGMIFTDIGHYDNPGPLWNDFLWSKHCYKCVVMQNNSKGNMTALSRNTGGFVRSRIFD